MAQETEIHRARPDDAANVGTLVGELLAEITAAIGTPAFEFDLPRAVATARELLEQERIFAFLARDGDARPHGVVALCESHALYAGGRFGTITELYVHPRQRSRALGKRLIARAREFGSLRGWCRLEVTTPPLPRFTRTLAFYEREGFAITGGRKLKVPL